MTAKAGAREAVLGSQPVVCPNPAKLTPRHVESMKLVDSEASQRVSLNGV